MQASQISSHEVRTRSMIKVRRLNMNKPHSDATTTRQTTHGPRRTMYRSHSPPTSRRATFPRKARQNNAPLSTGRTRVTQCRSNVQLSEALERTCRDTHRQLDVVLNGAPLPNNNNPVYLGVTLDRSLTYRKHVESLRSKVNARNGLLRCLAGSSWGAYTSTLRTGALALVYSAAASPAECRSTHTRKLDVALNDTMRIITGCMRPTETTFLPVLAGIMPPDIRREARVAKLTVTAKNNSEHRLHHKVTAPMRPARKYLYHAARSADTWPDSLMTITILPRRGVIALIAVHPSFRQPALSLDL